MSRFLEISHPDDDSNTSALTMPGLAQARAMVQAGLAKFRGSPDLPAVASVVSDGVVQQYENVTFLLKYDPADRSTWITAYCALVYNRARQPGDDVWKPRRVGLSRPHVPGEAVTYRFDETGNLTD